METPRIGLLVQRFDGLYQAELLRGLREEARALGAHLLCFPGAELESGNDFWREFNASFHVAGEVALDGIVSITGSYIWHLSQADQERFFRRFGATPIISVGETSGEIPRIRPDNRQGMAELVDHFIHDHGFRRIAFVAGPEHNTDARERIEVFRERHAAAGLTVDESLILKGEFYNLAACEATQRLLDEGRVPEAIIAANDEMGFAVVAALIEHGLDVPGDVAVAGFDDLATLLPEAPPLTSVSQDSAGQAALALRTLLAYLADGVPMPREILAPTRLVARRSCGCSGLSACAPAAARWEAPASAEQELTLLRAAADAEEAGEAGRIEAALGEALARARAGRRSSSDLRQHLQHLQREQLDAARKAGRPPGTALAALMSAPFWLAEQERIQDSGIVLNRMFPPWLHSRILVTRMSSDALSLAGMTRFLADGLLALGVRNAYLALYPRLGAVHRWDDCDIPAEAQLVLAIRGGEVLSSADFERFRVAELLPMPLFHEPDHAVYGLLPLFQHREHYGYLIVDMTREYTVSVEELREAISNLIASVMVVGELDRARELLRLDLDRAQASNAQLAALAENDVLTGLLNRRGFLTRVEALRAASPASLLLISIDLNGLKAINDTWGHAAGDDAICAMANVLRASFRPTDLTARFGGDEFAVVASSAGKDAEPRLRARLLARIEAFNVENTAPWRLSASVGIVAVAATDRQPLEEHLAYADRLMYAEKRRHKQVGEREVPRGAPPQDKA